MARFSVEQEDEGDERERPGSSSNKNKTTSSPTPSPKRLKLTISPQSQPPPPLSPQLAVDPPVVTEEEEEESENEIETEEEESVDDDDEDEEEVENHQPLPQTQPEVSEEGSRDGPISVILTDPDVLDCPICLEPLTVPVFQCENGHVACSSCCLKIRNKCPSCSWPIGYSRCRAIEKVLESVKVPCKNTKYGCKQMVKYCHKHEHENSCNLAPCSCPLPDCNFAGSSWHLYKHFRHKHPTSGKTFLFGKVFSVSLEKSQKSIILRESIENTIFILSHFSECHGSAINVVHLAPPGSDVRFSYELIARDGDTSIKLWSSVEGIPKWVDCPPAKKFLLVPSYYTGTSGQLKLDVCIRDDLIYAPRR